MTAERIEKRRGRIDTVNRKSPGGQRGPYWNTRPATDVENGTTGPDMAGPAKNGVYTDGGPKGSE